MPETACRPHKLFVGVDIAAATATVAWQTPGGAISRPLTIQQTPQGFTLLQQRLLAFGYAPAEILVVMEATGSYVRRITARAIPPAGRLGSEGNPGVNNSPRGESQREQQHVGEAERPRRRVWSGSARPVC